MARPPTPRTPGSAGLETEAPPATGIQDEPFLDHVCKEKCSFLKSSKRLFPSFEKENKNRRQAVQKEAEPRCRPSPWESPGELWKLELLILIFNYSCYY